jgi:hypothetical protein
MERRAGINRPSAYKKRRRISFPYAKGKWVAGKEAVVEKGFWQVE